MDSNVQKAFQLARQSRLKAYAPYSKYLVGAAVKAKDNDQIFTGCNVENSSFGATVCAERNAIFSLIAQNGKPDIEFIVLVTDNQNGALPCAMCLQVLSEFSESETPIYIGNLEKILRKLKFSELLPQPFSADSLPTT